MRHATCFLTELRAEHNETEWDGMGWNGTDINLTTSECVERERIQLELIDLLMLHG